MRPTRQPLTRVHTGNLQADAAQRLAQKTAQALGAIPFGGGTSWVRGLVFVANVAQNVNHGLGRAPQGYIVTRNYGPSVYETVGEATTQPPDVTRQIAMITAVNAKFDILFF